jgi:hypothetical protein
MVMGSSSSGGGGSEVAQAGTERAPEAMSDLKMAAKRTTTAMGSSGSSPPHKRFRATWTCQGPRECYAF